MDGTFEVVPHILHQLFTIFALVDGVVIPAVFCLMSCKSKVGYEKVFFELCGTMCFNGLDSNPKIIISDFEKGSVAVAKTFFPNTIFKGCFFHLGQIIWRRVQKMGLQKKYGECQMLSNEIRMIKSLAFINPNEISAYFDELKPTLSAEARTIADWFEKNYIGSKSRNGVIKRAAYAPSFWSVKEQVNLYLPTTQNHAEAWHRRIKVIVGQSHAGVYKLIGTLSDEYKQIIATMTQLNCGKFPKHTKKHTNENNIRRVLSMKCNRSKIDFLAALASNSTLTNIN